MTGSYIYTHKGNRKENDGTIVDIYTFKADLVNQGYIVEVLHLLHDIYVIQFYLKNHRLSDLRFNCLLNEYNNMHVFYVLNTVASISHSIIKNNRNASFGFMGAPIRREASRKKNAENINPDNTIKETKRYRTYSLYVKRYFNPKDFTHIEYSNSSCYLLKNNNNSSLTNLVAENYLNVLIAKKNSNYNSTLNED